MANISFFGVDQQIWVGFKDVLIHMMGYSVIVPFFHHHLPHVCSVFIIRCICTQYDGIIVVWSKEYNL